jgi:hypothetical protein
MDVEAATDKLAAQLGSSAAESEVLGGVAGALYADAYGGSLAEVNTAVGAVVTSIEGMGETTAGELEGVTAMALDFAKTFDVDVARAAQVAGQAVSTGLAEDAGQAFDLLVASSQRVPAALRADLLDAVDEYGTFFSSLGYSGEQAFAMLVDASADGMYGIDKMGDAVKEFSIRATDGSTATTAAFDAIGVDADAMAAAILAGGSSAQGATQQIVQGLLGITDPAAQARAAVALFGTPVEDLNVTEIPAFLASLGGASDSMADFGGAATEMGDTLNDNASTRVEAFKRDAQTAFVEVLGNQVLPVLTDAGARLQAMGLSVDGVSGFLERNRSTVTGVAIGVGALAAVVLAAKVGLAAYAAVMTVVNGALLAWRAAVAVATAVQWLWNAAMTANPIGLIIVAVAALVAGIVWLATQTTFFQTVWAAVWGVIRAPVMAVWNWIQGNWPLLLAILTGPVGAAVSWIVRNWDRITNAARSALSWVRSNWPLLLAILTGPVGMAVLAITRNWAAIKRGAGDLVSWFRGMPGRVADALRSVADRILSPFRSAFSAIARLWNRTVGSIGFRVPSWVPGVGGRSFNVPNIPTLAEGGIVKATPGGVLAILGEGGQDEAVVPLPRGAGQGAAAGGGGPATVRLEVSDSEVGRLLLSLLRRSVRTRGGRVELVLGARA